MLPIRIRLIFKNPDQDPLKRRIGPFNEKNVLFMGGVAGHSRSMSALKIFRGLEGRPDRGREGGAGMWLKDSTLASS